MLNEKDLVSQFSNTIKAQATTLSMLHNAVMLTPIFGNYAETVGCSMSMLLSLPTIEEAYYFTIKLDLMDSKFNKHKKHVVTIDSDTLEREVKFMLPPSDDNNFTHLLVLSLTLFLEKYLELDISTNEIKLAVNKYKLEVNG